jgi:hypothetical protein
MDEIGSAFSGSTFFIIRRRGSSTSYKLAGYMPSQPRIRQRIDNLSNPHGKFQ